MGGSHSMRWPCCIAGVQENKQAVTCAGSLKPLGSRLPFLKPRLLKAGECSPPSSTAYALPTSSTPPFIMFTLLTFHQTFCHNPGQAHPLAHSATNSLCHNLGQAHPLAHSATNSLCTDQAHSLTHSATSPPCTSQAHPFCCTSIAEAP